MAVALRGAASVPNGNPTTGFTVSVDAAVVADDDLFLVVTSRDHSSATAYPTVTDNDTGGNSWVRINSSTDRRANLYWKKATSGTGGKTVTVAGCVGSSSGVLKAFSGTLAGSSYANLGTESNASGDESDGGFTPFAADSMLCFAVCNYANDNAVTSMSSANHGALAVTEKQSTGGSDCATAFGHDLLTGSTATGAITWAQTNGATHSLRWSIQPAAAPDPVDGTADITIPGPTAAAAGEQVFTGTAGAAIPGPTAAATADQSMDGTASIAAPAPSIAATGDVEDVGPPPVDGEASIAAPGPSLAATGTETMTGTAAFAAPGPALAASGTETMTGTASVAAPAPSLAAAGAETLTGTAAVAAIAPALSSAGEAAFTGTAAVAIPGPSIAVTGAEQMTGTVGWAALAPAMAAAGSQESIELTGAVALAALGPVIHGVGDVYTRVQIARTKRRIRRTFWPRTTLLR